VNRSSDRATEGRGGLTRDHPAVEASRSSGTAARDDTMGVSSRKLLLVLAAAFLPLQVGRIPAPAPAHACCGRRPRNSLPAHVMFRAVLSSSSHPDRHRHSTHVSPT
jgi:hypothetical protein